MKHKILTLTAATLALALAFTACGNSSSDESEAGETTGEPVLENTPADTLDDTSADTSADTITLSDTNSEVTLTDGGTYTLTGSTSDGMVTVDAGESDVTLILSDLTIGNPDSAAIYVKSAGQVTITLEGENVLTNNGTFEMIGDEEVDAVIYCKTDLVMNGDGTIEIGAASGSAIVCKDAMTVEGGVYDLAVGEDGINTNDSLTITGGVFNIDAGDDAIHTDGILTVEAGVYDMTAAEGMEATIIYINDGDITIEASDDGINAAQKNEELTPYLEINGGTISVTMAAGDTDAIDVNGNIVINDGTIVIEGQSAFDYDGAVEYNGGTITVNGEVLDTIVNQFDGQMPGGMQGVEGMEGMQGMEGMEGMDGQQPPEGMTPPEGFDGQTPPERPDGQMPQPGEAFPTDMSESETEA